MLPECRQGFAPPQLLEGLSNHWWVIRLRGIVGVIFAVLAFAWPGAASLALVVV